MAPYRGEDRDASRRSGEAGFMKQRRRGSIVGGEIDGWRRRYRWAADGVLEERRGRTIQGCAPAPKQVKTRMRSGGEEDEEEDGEETMLGVGAEGYHTRRRAIPIVSFVNGRMDGVGASQYLEPHGTYSRMVKILYLKSICQVLTKNTKEKETNSLLIRIGRKA